MASVAATVIATPSQSPSRRACGSAARRCGDSSSAIRRSRAASGRPAIRIPATATNDSCQPGSPLARGFRASVAATASSSAYQRDDGREKRHRRDAGGTHHARALQRRSRTGQGHVERHKAQERDASSARADACRHEQRQGERHQQHHVLPAHRQQVSETGVAPVVARGAGQSPRPRRAPCRAPARRPRPRGPPQRPARTGGAGRRGRPRRPGAWRR